MNYLFNGKLSGDDREKEAAYCAGFNRNDYFPDIINSILKASEEAAIREFQNQCRKMFIR